MLKDNQAFSVPRQAVIAQTPALQERVLTKTAGLISDLSGALRRRGVEDRAAMLAAQVGMAVFGHAANAWFENPSLGLRIHLERAFPTLHGLSASGSPAPR
jgi:hypothetical protein